VPSQLRRISGYFVSLAREDPAISRAIIFLAEETRARWRESAGPGLSQFGAPMPSRTQRWSLVLPGGNEPDPGADAKGRARRTRERCSFGYDNGSAAPPRGGGDEGFESVFLVGESGSPIAPR